MHAFIHWIVQVVEVSLNIVGALMFLRLAIYMVVNGYIRGRNHGFEDRTENIWRVLFILD